jgi:hypothetical protein
LVGSSGGGERLLQQHVEDARVWASSTLFQDLFHLLFMNKNRWILHLTHCWISFPDGAYNFLVWWSDADIEDIFLNKMCCWSNICALFNGVESLNCYFSRFVLSQSKVESWLMMKLLSLPKLCRWSERMLWLPYRRWT